MKNDLYCIGGLAVDILLEIPRFPLPNEKLVVQFAGYQPGGLVANAACSAARLGLKTSWFGLVGDDAHSRMLLDVFSSFGVHTSEVVIKENSPSDFTVILLQPDGERTILVVPVLPSPPPLTLNVKNALQNTHVAYTVPYQRDWFLEFAELVHSCNGKVALDVEGCLDQYNTDIETVLKHADIVFCSKDGLQIFSHKNQVADGAARILSLGSEMVIATFGEKGARLFTQSTHYSTPAFDVPLVDTTGAGDCFHAACIYGLLSRWDLQRCLDFSSAAAALVVQKLGAREGLPTFDEVKIFLSTNQKRRLENNELYD